MFYFVEIRILCLKKIKYNKFKLFYQNKIFENNIYLIPCIP